MSANCAIYLKRVCAFNSFVEIIFRPMLYLWFTVSVSVVLSMTSVSHPFTIVFDTVFLKRMPFSLISGLLYYIMMNERITHSVYTDGSVDACSQAIVTAVCMHHTWGYPLPPELRTCYGLRGPLTPNCRAKKGPRSSKKVLYSFAPHIHEPLSLPPGKIFRNSNPEWLSLKFLLETYCELPRTDNRKLAATILENLLFAPLGMRRWSRAAHCANPCRNPLNTLWDPKTWW